MRTRLIACLSLLTTFGTAGAAVTLPDGPFTGFYVGLHGGGTVWDTLWVDRDDWVDNFGNDFSVGTVPKRIDHFTWGAQLGYNWQCNHTVYGIEVDWSSVRTSHRTTYAPAPGNQTVLILNHDLDWYGSVRGRAGVVGDILLLYVTGGAAFARMTHDWTTISGIETEGRSLGDTNWGAVGGVGAEWTVFPRVSIKAEGLYYTFRDRTSSLLSPNGAQIVRFDNIDSFVVGRVGINYSL